MKKNLFAQIAAEIKAERNSSKEIREAKKAEARQKAEEMSYNLLTGVYAPSYVAGYAFESGKAVVEKVVSTKAGQTVKKVAADVKFSAKEGFNNGREAKIEADSARMYRKAMTQIESDFDDEDWEDWAEYED